MHNTSRGGRVANSHCLLQCDVAYLQDSSRAAGSETMGTKNKITERIEALGERLKQLNEKQQRIEARRVLQESTLRRQLSRGCKNLPCLEY
jgi:hypothetical protein